MPKYAIPIVEDVLDLIQVINDGVRPQLESEPTYFVFETDGTNDTKNHEIVFQDKLYEGKTGHTGNGYIIRLTQ